MVHAVSLALVALIAQTTQPAASPDAKARAQALLTEGAELYQAGSVAAAYEKFSAAYEEFKSPKLLFNIGQTSRDLGRLPEAMDAFTRFLAEELDAPEQMTAEAKRSVEELQLRMGRLHIQCPTADAEISLDGRLIGNSPVTDVVWAMPGSHQLTARHANMLPAIENVEVKAGWMHTVVMTLQPLVKLDAVASDVAPAASPPPATATVEGEVSRSLPQGSAARDQGWWLGKKWAWVASGATIVFVGSAAIFGVSMQSKFNSLNKSCGSAAPAAGGTWTGCDDSEVDSVALRRNLANVSWGLAAATAATAGVLFAVEGRSVSAAPMVGQATGVMVGMAY